MKTNSLSGEVKLVKKYALFFILGILNAGALQASQSPEDHLWQLQSKHCGLDERELSPQETYLFSNSYVFHSMVTEDSDQLFCKSALVYLSKDSHRMDSQFFRTICYRKTQNGVSNQFSTDRTRVAIKLHVQTQYSITDDQMSVDLLGTVECPNDWLHLYFKAVQ